MRAAQRRALPGRSDVFHSLPARMHSHRADAAGAALQAGAGLVADSVPESEYQETINKANAMSRAIDLAEDAFAAAAPPPPPAQEQRAPPG